jgi:hypothetical protein
VKLDWITFTWTRLCSLPRVWVAARAETMLQSPPAPDRRCHAYEGLCLCFSLECRGAFPRSFAAPVQTRLVLHVTFSAKKERLSSQTSTAVFILSKGFGEICRPRTHSYGQSVSDPEVLINPSSMPCRKRTCPCTTRFQETKLSTTPKSIVEYSSLSQVTSTFSFLTTH